MLITYRGRQYDSTRRPPARQLAALLLIPACLEHLYTEGAPQAAIDRALWEAILTRIPGSLTAEQIGGTR